MYGRPFYNYFSLKDNIFVTTTCKSKKLAKRTIKLPQELSDIIKTFKLKSNSEYILPSAHNVNVSMTSNSIGNMLERLLKVSSSMLRKIYISQRYDQGVTKQDKALIAHIMGHSVVTAERDYAKFTKIYKLKKQLPLDTVNYDISVY